MINHYIVAYHYSLTKLKILTVHEIVLFNLILAIRRGKQEAFRGNVC